MEKQKTPLEHAAGKLISSLQKEWGAEAGEPGADISEEAMHKCHSLLHGAKNGSLQSVLRGASVTDFIGRAWVRAHPRVLPAIRAFEEQVAISAGAQPAVEADGHAPGQ
ncbi:hypothetical protein DFR24_4830 [Panacagrimonas perspica]|uniref:Uncharacterized protein n=1 Tax=Panacagrimonas perspica TaxID=381431 RepID=A0A4V3F3Y6_9GAMM|nr:hypothetical protein DFR24_4830 [Panacagrimonas perspica]THD02522.1 hypothetical protein B1810_14315 [Panacagrimonas perspica]